MIGLAVPGMPVGSPEMEVKGAKLDEYSVILFGPAGRRVWGQVQGGFADHLTGSLAGSMGDRPAPFHRQEILWKSAAASSIVSAPDHPPRDSLRCLRVERIKAACKPGRLPPKTQPLMPIEALEAS